MTYKMVIENSTLTFIEEGLTFMDEILLILVKPCKVKNKFLMLWMD